VVTPEVHEKIMDQIMVPAVRAMAAEMRPYRGLLYAGLMIANGEPRVLEFNVRFGDPEAQPVLMRLESELLPLLEAATEGRLREAEVRWRKEAAVCVVLAAAGYPGAHDTGKRIEGLADLRAMPDVQVFHAGTARAQGDVVTSGGRVLGVTALGADIQDAMARAYGVVERIRWDGMHYRTDIGKKAITPRQA
jgi:phosphoribosylamine--glycine ligase